LLELFEQHEKKLERFFLGTRFGNENVDPVIAWPVLYAAVALIELDFCKVIEFSRKSAG